MATAKALLLKRPVLARREQIAGEPKKRSLLFDLPFFSLWLGQVISQVGDGLNRVALLWFVYELTGSAAKMALIGILQTLPAIALGMVAGAYLDRHSRKKTMIVTDMVRFMLMMFIPSLYYFGWLTFPILCLSVFLFSCVSTVFGPALLTSVPFLVGKERLREANSLIQSTTYTGVLMGPAVSGLLIPILGAQNVLYIDGLTFLISALCILPLKIRDLQPKEAHEGDAGQSVFEDIKEGARFVFFDNRVVLGVMTVALVYNFSLNPLPLMFSVFSERILQAGPKAMGLMMSGLGAGALVTSLLLANLRKNMKEGLAMGLALGIAGLVLLSLTHLHSLSLALVLSMMMGSCTTTMNVMFVTTLQTQAPMRLLGRVFTTFSTTAQAATPIGMMTAGYLLDTLGVGKTLSVFGMILLIVSLTVLVLKPSKAGRTLKAA